MPSVRVSKFGMQLKMSLGGKRSPIPTNLFMTNGTLMVGAESDPLVHGHPSREICSHEVCGAEFLVQHDTGG